MRRGYATLGYMAPHWVRTKDKWPHLYRADEQRDDDLLLLTGDWVVGRVLPAAGVPGPPRWSWSLTGPHSPEAGVPTHGDAPGLEEAKAALVASFRRWQQWAGMTDRADPGQEGSKAE